MSRIVALLLAALCTACASTPERVACHGVSVSAPAPAGPFPGYVAAPTRKDVLVFTHGLGGDAVKTWTNRKGVYWPRVVANDPQLADYDVYVYAYETNPRGECLGIPDLATQMHARLVGDRVFETHDRVIFVSHSLGGLIVREMLTTFDELIPKTPLLLFYGTPGHGAEVARWAAMLTRCQQVQDVRPVQMNSFIRSLNNSWKHRISGRVRSRCAIEGFDIRGVGRLVKPATAEALCDDIPLTIAGDHFGIVKVDCDRDDPHVFLKNVLSEGQPSRLAVTASSLSVRRITDVADVGEAVVAPDGKTVFVTRFASLDVTDISGAPPRKLFDTFYGSVACAKASCYFGGLINEQLGVYRFNVGEPPRLMFSGWVQGLAVNHAGDRLLMERRGREGQSTELVVRQIDDDAQTIERSSSAGMLHQASWHPDGKSILYVESMKEGVVVLQDIATGKQTDLLRVAAGTFVDAVAWEAGGRYVLAYTRTGRIGEFWILRPEGQPIGPIRRDEGVSYGNLRTTPLPDTFAAVRGEGRTLPRLASLESQTDERLIGGKNVKGPFAWTGPERLLYVAKDDTGSWIAEYDIHAQQERRLSPTASISNPVLTPDGTRLVFSMSTADAQFGLWASPADRWNPVNLAQLPILTHAISPDSKWVAFAAFGPEGGLYVTTLEPGGEVRRLARGSIWQVSFAGSRTIVFKRDSDGRRPICKVSRDGGAESCFALNDTHMFVMSPDGKTIAAVTHHNSQSRLHFIDIASGAVSKVVTVPAWIDTQSGMVWTADKAKIVYATSTSHSTTAVESYGIVDGANDVVLKSAEGQIMHLTASPDDRYVVFQRHSISTDAVLLTVTR